MLAVALTTTIGLTWDIPHQRGYLSLFSILALVALSLGLTAIWVPGITWALCLLAAQYWARLVLDPSGTAVWAPLFGGLLLLCAELAFLSLEMRSASRPRLRGRLLAIGFLCLGGATAGELTLFATAVLPARGFVFVVGGAIAVGALLVGLLAAAGRTGSQPRQP